LCLFHLVRARAARSWGDDEAARRDLTEGLHLARQCSLGLYHVELLAEQAELLLSLPDAPAAEAVAREALQRASASECQFRWGAAQASHLVGKALLAQDRKLEARDLLQTALSLRRHIGDPGADDTERLLDSVQGPG
jgi:hypothetical protein